MTHQIKITNTWSHLRRTNNTIRSSDFQAPSHCIINPNPQFERQQASSSVTFTTKLYGGVKAVKKWRIVWRRATDNCPSRTRIKISTTRGEGEGEGELLGALLAEDAELLGGEDSSPLLLRLLDLSRGSSHGSAPTDASGRDRTSADRNLCWWREEETDWLIDSRERVSPAPRVMEILRGKMKVDGVFFFLIKCNPGSDFWSGWRAGDVDAILTFHFWIEIHLSLS